MNKIHAFLNIFTWETASWIYIENQFTFAFEIFEIDDVLYVLEFDGAIFISLIATDLKRNVPVGQIGMPSHFVENFCHDWHPKAVCTVDYEEDAIDVRVEEGPAFTVTTLDKDVRINFEILNGDCKVNLPIRSCRTRSMEFGSQVVVSFQYWYRGWLYTSHNFNWNGPHSGPVSRCYLLWVAPCCLMRTDSKPSNNS
mgnify:CR=1 FL=1